MRCWQSGLADRSDDRRDKLKALSNIPNKMNVRWSKQLEVDDLDRRSRRPRRPRNKHHNSSQKWQMAFCRINLFISVLLRNECLLFTNLFDARAITKWSLHIRRDWMRREIQEILDNTGQKTTEAIKTFMSATRHLCMDMAKHEITQHLLAGRGRK